MTEKQAMTEDDELALQGALLLSDSDSRAAYLRQVCGANTRRCNMLLDLISFAEEGDRLFESDFSPARHAENDGSLDEFSVLARRKIGKFQLVRTLGSGGMGTVFLARDVSLDRLVALKLPRLDGTASDVTFTKLLNEARLAAQLRHQGLVSLLEVGNVGPMVYIASEWCELGDLACWLAGQRGPQDQRVVAEFVARIADAISYMHARGVVHLDLKPANILLSKSGAAPGLVDAHEGDTQALALEVLQPRVTDFGISRVLDDDRATKTNTTLMVGTPLYMAPEQLTNERREIGEQSDIFAIGSILAELLGLDSPRDGQSYVEILATVTQQPIHQLTDAAKCLPRDLGTILTRCMATSPGNRYATAKELAEDLRAFASQRAIVATPIGMADRFRHWGRSEKRIVEAWWIVLATNIIMIGWMAAGMGLMLGQSFPGSNRSYAILSSLGLVVGNCLPVVAFSILGLRGYRWPLKPAFCFVFFGVVCVSAIVLLGFVDVVPGLYDDAPFFKVLNHALVLICGLVQTIPLMIAILGRRGSFLAGSTAKQKRGACPGWMEETVQEIGQAGLEPATKGL